MIARKNAPRGSKTAYHFRLTRRVSIVTNKFLRKNKRERNKKARIRRKRRKRKKKKKKKKKKKGKKS